MLPLRLFSLFPSLRRTWKATSSSQKLEHKMAEQGSENPDKKPEKKSQFPRTSDPPQQSPKYWVKEKDRYLRQILIGDIEAMTKRPLAVYFSQLDQEINHTDPDDLSEILLGINDENVDLLIQTPGGNVDATEKIISVLNYRFKHYRVIVPSWAKSAGTVIALSSNEIVLGVNSELGPIDPQMRTAQGALIPCEILANDTAQPYHVRQICDLTVQRNRQLATDLLKKGMMKGKTDGEIATLVSKISTANSYKSHGAVINHDEASNLGLSVKFLDYKDELWNRLWLLYCMYDYDTKAKNIGKMTKFMTPAKFSSCLISDEISIPKAPSMNPLSNSAGNSTR